MKKILRVNPYTQKIETGEVIAESEGGVLYEDESGNKRFTFLTDGWEYVLDQSEIDELIKELGVNE